MASSWIEKRQAEGVGPGVIASGDADEDASKQNRLVGERTWPGFEFIDVVAHHEGELVGWYLNTHYDWNVLDPHLMK